MPSYTKNSGFERRLDDTGFLPKLNSVNVTHHNASQFGEVLSVSRTPIYYVNSADGTSLRRDIVTTANGGTKDDINGTVTTGEILLETNTTVNGSVRLESSKVGIYHPGYSSEIGVGIRTTQVPTGTQVAMWGGRTPDGNNGFHFGYDANGIYVARYRNGAEVGKTYQSEWNIDKLDGTGNVNNVSGVNLNTNDGVVFQVQYTWYGYGQILFGVIATVENKQVFLPVHQMKNFSQTSVTNPSLRVYVKVDNGASSASNFPLYVGGRQYSIIGKLKSNYRHSGDTRGLTTVSTTVTPLISFRYKAGFENRSVLVDGYDLINTGNTPIYLQIRLNGTLTNPSFVTPADYTASEAAVEVDKSATAISGGEILWSGSLVDGGKGNATVFTDKDVELDVPNGSTIHLCAATFSGTSEVYSGFKLKEGW